jgi:hypothetical protein
MARNKAEAAISDDTRDMLENQVKKGKSRKFILISKGASIISLIVFKKGPYGPRLNEARKAGLRGQSVCGVITGKGVDLRLLLPGTPEVAQAMKADGVCDSDPVKIAVLRKFLTEEAGVKFKPSFEIIQQLGDVPIVSEGDEEGEPSVSASTATPEQETPETPAAAEPKDKLATALKQLRPLMQKALESAPQRKDDILGPVTSIKQLMAGNDLAAARQMLLDHAALLKGLVSGNPTEATPSSDVASESRESPIEMWREFKERVDQQVSALQQALKGFDHPDLNRIADAGLNGVTGGLQVQLQRALLEYDSASSDERPRAESALIKAATEYETFLNTDKMIALCDNNPFGVDVAIQATLTEGLRRIRGSLATAAPQNA